MRRLVVSEYVTLDGIVESPEQWQFPYLSPDVAEFIQTQIAGFETLLLGRRTYDVFAAAWPSRTNNEFGVADKLNRMPKFVVSTTLQRVDWNNSTLIPKDVTKEVGRLKQGSKGEVAVIGSATLARWLMEHDLVDEIRLLVHPVVVGRGQRLFPEGTKQVGMRVVESRVFQSGVIGLSLQPAPAK
jgi:dihydrofolate reductase